MVQYFKNASGDDTRQRQQFYRTVSPLPPSSGKRYKKWLAITPTTKNAAGDDTRQQQYLNS